MKLSQKRRFFTHKLAQLILRINERPSYSAQLLEVYRPLAQAMAYADEGIGIKNSLHCVGLAADIALFKEDIYLTDSSDYEWVGEIWEMMSDDRVTCCWGGRFKKPDGNHFSVEHGSAR